jgi:hypothetical protein
VGTKAATLSAGSGRRSVTITLDGTETGHVTVRLQPSAVCSFKNVKLEIGAFATPWTGELPAAEELNCRRYYQALPLGGGSPAILAAFGQRVGANIIDIPCALPVPMRASPTLVTSGAAWTAGSPAGNQIGFYNNGAASWTALSGALTLTTAAPAGTSAVVLRLQAGTSFSGTAGSGGVLHLGGAALVALQAEL